MATAQIPLNEWLVDVAEGHEGRRTLALFRVLEVGDGTVLVEDEHGIKRAVNRIVLEGDLERGDVVNARQHLKREGA